MQQSKRHHFKNPFCSSFAFTWLFFSLSSHHAFFFSGGKMGKKQQRILLLLSCSVSFCNFYYFIKFPTSHVYAVFSPVHGCFRCIFLLSCPLIWGQVKLDKLLLWRWQSVALDGPSCIKCDISLLPMLPHLSSRGLDINPLMLSISLVGKETYSSCHKINIIKYCISVVTALTG